ARGGPQLVVPAVRGGAIEEEIFQALELLVAQTRRRAGMGLGGQSVGAGACLALPTVQRVAAYAEDAGDIRGGLALVHQIDGAAAAAFQFCGSTNGSAHT